MWMSLAPALNRLHQQVVHEVDDRAAVDQRLDVHQVDVGAVGLQLDGAFVDVGGHRVDFEAFVVAARQRPLDAAAEGEHRADAELRDPLDLVDLLEILRIGHGDAERVADLEQGERVEPLGDPPRDQPHGDRVDDAVAEPRGRHAEMAFDERQDGLFLDHAHVDQRFAEPQAFLRTFGQGLVELLRRDDVGADEQLAERAGAAQRRDGGGGFRRCRRVTELIAKSSVLALPVSPNTSNRAPTPVTLSTSLQSAPGFASFIAPPIR